MLCISKHTWGSEVDNQIEELLCRVFVGEGYAISGNASKTFTSQKLKSRGTAYVATESATGRIIGVIFYVPGGSDSSQIAAAQEAEIHLLAVDPQYRGSGAGKKLIASCLEYAENDNVTRMVLSTQASMRLAHRLYKGMGFIRNESRDWPRPAGGTYLVFEKQLNESPITNENH